MAGRFVITLDVDPDLHCLEGSRRTDSGLHGTLAWSRAEVVLGYVSSLVACLGKEEIGAGWEGSLLDASRAVVCPAAEAALV